ncbi:Outer membrane lipoprotein omp16 precursor [hydrothermal vent metagenome]|uniref:Outer membrane lipoprotein omp16 n=1 Tax=hydrothermal vent metagenome TaxID=652676 RepID=A0A3B0UC88_9ZZZZ
MIKIYKIFLILIFVGAASLNGLAQQSLIQRGDVEFQHKDYVKAEALYKKALHSVEGDKKNQIIRKIADCCRLMNELEEAAGYYEKYVNNTDSPGKEALYNFATILLETGQIEKSESLFTKLLKDYPGDSEFSRMVECCEFARTESAKKDQPEIVDQQALNSDKSEFGLAWFQGKLVFASKRLVNDYSSIHGRTNQGFSDLYIASYDSVYNLFTEPIQLKGGINSPYNDGTFAYDSLSNTAYFTQCKKKPGRCMIFKGKYAEGKWVDITPLSFHQPGYDFAHPSLTPDGHTLYFVSDMPGGQGGKDIWKAKLSNEGLVVNVENLGEMINTGKDEMFPYILGDSILFFSSNGHIGMGGLDIFYSKREQGLFTKPVNLGAPINSTSDDFSILFDKNLNGGYFCSNRENTEKSDDIYRFNHNIFHSDIKGIVNDSISLRPLGNAGVTYFTDSDAKVITYTNAEGEFNIPYFSHNNCGRQHKLLFEKKGYIRKTVKIGCDAQKSLLVLLWDGEIVFNTLAGEVANKQSGAPLEGVKIIITSAKGVKDSVSTDSEGIYVSTKILSNDIYNIRASKEGFLSESRKIMIPETQKSLIISEKNGYKTNFGLIPVILKKEFRIDNIYYEFDKAALLEESKKELDKLVNILTENPDITIRINSHTDDRGPGIYNQKLSERRGAGVVRYLVAHGIDKGRLFSRGYGETRLLIAKAKTDEEHRYNRRTTFEIVGTTFNTDVVNAGLEKGKIIKEKYSNTEIKQIQGKAKSHDTSTAKTVKKAGGGQVYGIQIFATGKTVDVQSELKNISSLIDKYGLHIKKAGRLNKYQLGPIGLRGEATKMKEVLIGKGYKGSFLIPMDE